MTKMNLTWPGLGRLELNATWIFLAEVSGRALNLVLLVLLARWLGRGGLGVYTFAYLVAESVLALVGFGFDSLAVRDLARRPALAGRYLVHMVGTRLLLLLPAGALGALVFLQKEGGRAQLDLYLLVLGAAFLHQQLLLLGAFARARQEMWREALSRFALALLALGGGAAALALGGGVEGVVAARLGAALLAGAPTLVMITRLFRLRLPSFRLARARRLWGAAVPLAVLFLAVQLYTALPGIVLGLVRGDAAVGLYGGAWRLFMLCLMAAGALSGSALPGLARAAGAGEGAFDRELTRGCRLMLLVGLPLAAGCLVSGERAALFLLGPEFAPSGTLLALLALVLVPDFLNHQLAAGLVARGRSRLALAAALVGMGVALVGSWPLVEAAGPTGAAWAFVAGRLAVFGCQGAVMLPRLAGRLLLGDLARGGAAAAGAGLLLWWAGPRLGSLPLEALAWPLLYLGGLFLAGGPTRRGVP